MKDKSFRRALSAKTGDSRHLRSDKAKTIGTPPISRYDESRAGGFPWSMRPGSPKEFGSETANLEIQFRESLCVERHGE